MNAVSPEPSHFRLARQVQGRGCFADVTLLVEPVERDEQAETLWQTEDWPEFHAGMALGIDDARERLGQPLRVTVLSLVVLVVDTSPQSMALAACSAVLQALGEPVPTNYAEQLKAYADLLGE